MAASKGLSADSTRGNNARRQVLPEGEKSPFRRTDDRVAEISGGGRRIEEKTRECTVEAYYQGLNEKLLAAIPAARQVLELGCAGGRLGEAYKRTRPTVVWTGVDVSREALQAAAKRLDATYCIDLDTDSLDVLGTGYDCVVFGDLLEHLKTPERLLRKLCEITTEDATLVCCVPNMGHISVLERMLMGDISYESQGLLDRTHLRFFSVSSLFKMLLDCGWLPNLHDRYAAGHGNEKLKEKLIEAAATLGVPPAWAQNFLLTYQVVVKCTKRAEVIAPEVMPRVSVLVALNNDAQFGLNVASSPGIREIGAEVIPCRGARTAAEAFEMGAARAAGDWLVFCHQDVYFPAGTGHALARHLSSIAPQDRRSKILGFAGIALDRDGRPQRSGLVIDRGRLFDYPSSASAISLDEFCIVVGRDVRWKIDGNLGWHLWATDLCLQALLEPSEPSFAETLRIPFFHNSFNDFCLPESFHVSAKKLSAKYSQLTAITTLCGTILGAERFQAASGEPYTPATAGKIKEPTQTPSEIAAELSAKGKWAEALSVVDAALAQCESAELWNSWGTVHYCQGHVDQAEDGYRRALALEVSHRQAAVNLGLFLFSQGRLEEAMQLLERHKNTLSTAEKQAIAEMAARMQAAVAQQSGATAQQASAAQASSGSAHTTT